MEALHDDRDPARPLVVESSEKCVVVPVIRCLTDGVREGVGRLHWVIDDDVVGAAAREYAADRGREPVAQRGGNEFLDRLLLWGEPGPEQAVPRVHHDGTASARQLLGELLGV